MQNRPLYPIGVVSELLNVHPETVRVWERYDVVQPQRRSNRRFYSENDLKRLRFVQMLREKGLNKAAISHYITLYPCWEHGNCPPCMRRSENNHCGKPCWKEEGTYCISSNNETLCSNCRFSEQGRYFDRTAIYEDTSPLNVNLL